MGHMSHERTYFVFLRFEQVEMRVCRYPNAELDSTTGNLTCDGTAYSNLQRFGDARYRLVRPLDRDAAAAAADDDASTLLSPIRHQNGSPPRHHRSPCSVEGSSSVETSSSLDSVSTNDDAAFRAGLAQLDADIALVQRRLRGGSPFCGPASAVACCRSPRPSSGRRS